MQELTRNQVRVFLPEGGNAEQAALLAERLQTELVTEIETGELCLRADALGLSLTDGTLSLSVDFSQERKRLSVGNLQREMLVKACRIKGQEHTDVLDATAGLGEDSILLAASGFAVNLYEYNPIIFALLKDGLLRASAVAELAETVGRMTLHEEDSILAMRNLAEAPDVVLLDPMFPQRQKSALVKKKFQLLQRLESPCSDGAELLQAAVDASPKKIVIKRPIKGEYLAGKKPDYSLEGKAIRYDCFVFAR